MKRILLVALGLLILGGLSTLGLAATVDTATVNVVINADILSIDLTTASTTITIADLPVSGPIAGVPDLAMKVWCNKAAGYDVNVQQFAWGGTAPFALAGIQMRVSGGTFASTPISPIVDKNAVSAVGGDPYTVNVQYNPTGNPLLTITAGTYTGTAIFQVTDYT